MNTSRPHTPAPRYHELSLQRVVAEKENERARWDARANSAPDAVSTMQNINKDGLARPLRTTHVDAFTTLHLLFVSGISTLLPSICFESLRSNRVWVHGVCGDGHGVGARLGYPSLSALCQPRGYLAEGEMQWQRGGSQWQRREASGRGGKPVPDGERGWQRGNDSGKDGKVVAEGEKVVAERDTQWPTVGGRERCLSSHLAAAPQMPP